MLLQEPVKNRIQDAIVRQSELSQWHVYGAFVGMGRLSDDYAHYTYQLVQLCCI